MINIMKQTIWSIIVIFIVSLSACFDDDSTLGNPNYNDIIIGELKDTTITSFMGNVLTITPEIETGYDTSMLSYAWYIFSGSDEMENGFRENKIAETRTLNYEVNLTSGNYTIIFEAISNNDELARTASMQLTTVTAFSNGFYILKETADGNSDLDILGTEGLSENVVSEMYGEAIPGKPTNLAVTYDQCYVDEETTEQAGTNMMHVFTDASQYRGFRTEDLALIFDQTTLRFDGLDADEIPYTMARGFMTIYFLTNKGVYSNYPFSMIPSSGKFGLPAEGDAGGSKFIIPVGGGTLGYHYWNNEEHTLYTTDYNGSSALPIGYDTGNISEANLKCLASGENKAGSTATGCFICEDETTGERYLYLVDLLSGSVTPLIKLDEDLHISQGEIVAILGNGASYIYSVHNGSVYVYNWNEGGEFEVNLPGIPDSEKITYLSNQYLNPIMNTDIAFDNLVVATQTGDNYHLYFYENMIGGIPDPNSEPKVIEGTGTIKSVRFVSASLDPFEFMNVTPIWGYPPLMPYCD